MLLEASTRLPMPMLLRRRLRKMLLLLLVMMMTQLPLWGKM
jgi:hypothetical protein